MITLRTPEPRASREERRTGRKRIARMNRKNLAVSGAALIAAGVAGGILAAAALTPAIAGGAYVTKVAAATYDAYPTTLPATTLPGRATIVAADGSLIANTYTINRIPVDGTAMSQHVRDAVVAVEDARFYRHNGFDTAGIVRALNATASGDGVQGGSTLTQQYVKNLLVADTAAHEDEQDDVPEGDSRTIERKLRELKLAIHTERDMTKDDILTGYLNVAYFGAGAYGVEAAAQRYYSTSAATLTVNQGATLAGLVQAPTTYDPRHNPDAATARRNQVLHRMHGEEMITQSQLETDIAAPLGLLVSSPATGCTAARPGYGFVCEQALNELANADWIADGVRRALLVDGNYILHTTIDTTLQEVAARTARGLVPAQHRVANAGVSVQPGTGNILASASNRTFGTGKGATEIPLPSTPKFSPGSTFKVFTLIAALEKGIPVDTVLPAGNTYTSQVFNNPPGGYHNAEGLSGWNVTLRQATASSLNTAYVQLMEKTSVASVADVARRLGITSIPARGQPGAPGKKNGSFTLGVEDVSVTAMAGAYAALAAGGTWCAPHVISSIDTPAGTHTHPGADACSRKVAGPVASTTSSILKTVVDNGTGKAARIPGRDVAGKTGTGEDLSSAWFAGYTPQIATAVWTGDPASPQNVLRNVLGYDKVYGSTLPADLWSAMTRTYVKNLPKAKLPGVDPAYLLALGPPAGDTNVMPALIGIPVDQARGTLEAGGYIVTVEPAPAAAHIPVGTITGTSPSAGGTLTDASSIIFTVAADRG